MDINVDSDFVTALCAVFMAIYALTGRFTSNIQSKLENVSDEIKELMSEFGKVQQEVSYIKGRQDQSNVIIGQATETIRNQTLKGLE